MFMMLKNIVF